MSYVFNMVGGGSGGGSGPSASDAILTVTVPTGSTVTMTKGGVTLTPTMWVQAADNTLDCALFVISPSLFDAVNAWTVTATLSDETASDTVTIDSNKQYDVELTYNYYLFKSGIGSVIPLTYGHESLATISVGTSEISVNYTTNSGYQIYCCNTNAIDLSGFSALCVEGIITERQIDSAYGGSVDVARSMFGLSDRLDDPKYVAKTFILTGPSTQTTVLDISSIVISGYVGIRGGMRGTISAIYLK